LAPTLLAGARLFGTRRLRSALANLMGGKTISETARARPQKNLPHGFPWLAGLFHSRLYPSEQ
jgi:hypothetical protein